MKVLLEIGENTTSVKKILLSFIKTILLKSVKILLE